MSHSNFHFEQDEFSRYTSNIIRDYQSQIETMLPATQAVAAKKLPGHVPVSNSQKGVGIVGGGVGGLYAAMMLQSLKIDYEVLEATNDVGGRLYTYQFDKSKPPGGLEYFVSLFLSSMLLS